MTSTATPSVNLNPLIAFTTTFFEPFSISIPSQTEPIRVSQEILAEHREEFWYGNMSPDDVFEYRTVEVPFAIAQHLPNRNLTEHECRSIGITQSRGWVNFFRKSAESNILLFRRPCAGVSEEAVNRRMNEEIQSGIDWVSKIPPSSIDLVYFPMSVFDTPEPRLRTDAIHITSPRELRDWQLLIFQTALNN